MNFSNKMYGVFGLLILPIISIQKDHYHLNDSYVQRFQKNWKMVKSLIIWETS